MATIFGLFNLVLTVVAIHSVFAWGVIPGWANIAWAQAVCIAAVLQFWLLGDLSAYLNERFADEMVAKGRVGRDSAMLGAVVGDSFLRVMTILVMRVLFRV